MDVKQQQQQIKYLLVPGHETHLYLFHQMQMGKDSTANTACMMVSGRAKLLNLANYASFRKKTSQLVFGVNMSQFLEASVK